MIPAGLAGLAAATLLAAFPPPQTTTWLQARVVDLSGEPTAEAAFAFFGSGAPQTAIVSDGSYVIIDELIPGVRDRLCVSSSLLGTTCSEYRDVPIDPAIRRRVFIVPEDQLDLWRAAASVDVDGTSGQVVGVVQDTLGQPVAGAVVSLEPASGIPFTFDADGSPQAGTTTGADGTFVFFNTTAGELKATATSGSTVVGLAYGRSVDRQTDGLTLRPPLGLAGLSTDALTGAPVGGATVSWDFDPTVTTVSSGSGDWTLTVADGLDLTLRGAAAGYREGRSFVPGAAASATALTMPLLSDASYTAIPAGFGILQAPTLGLIIGRVVDAAGGPVAGAVIEVDPVDGTGVVRYFDAAGQPAPAATATSASGLFAVLNVALGPVVLKATSPLGAIRSVVAPTIAGGVTAGELRAFETQAVFGTVIDEVGAAVGGALVQVLEFPQIAVLAAPNGTFTLNGVPKGALVSLRASKPDYVDTYTFRRNTGFDDQRAQNIFIVSDVSVNGLYATRDLTFDQSRGLISTSLRASTGNGVKGLSGTTVPASGFVSYPGNDNENKDETSNLGTINILAATPGDSGIAINSPDTDVSILQLAPIRAGSATVDALGLDCDSSAQGLVPIYPCQGARVLSDSKPAEFHWNGDEAGKFQVQFSGDPSFSDVRVSSKNSNKNYVFTEFWDPSKKKWKKILSIGAGGVPIYWRIVQRTFDEDNDPVDAFSTPSYFTVIQR